MLFLFEDHRHSDYHHSSNSIQIVDLHVVLFSYRKRTLNLTLSLSSVALNVCCINICLLEQAEKICKTTAQHTILFSLLLFLSSFVTIFCYTENFFHYTTCNYLPLFSTLTHDEAFFSYKVQKNF